MKTTLKILIILTISFQMKAQEWQTPEIEGYGKIKYFEDAAELPDTSLTYKMIFNIDSEKEKEGVNVGLWRIARTLNILKAGNISNEKIDIVAVLHGEATYAILTDKEYKKRFQTQNPNMGLLRLLKENGVTVLVCGQAMASRNIEKEHLNLYVEMALSALTVLPNYQLKGYALIP
ncbi:MULTISPECIES: DsrE family protein [Flavobacteriaceae]|uniref:Uncharacterized protein n=3 Tax=Flavobacteriaceae TaxID=49546 RepID=A0A1L7IAG3_9FLAO|nr:MULTISPECIES: DsrE family protein [Flavobacteriaceae]APU70112.1 hypothetical protein GRFL_3388 [Christiangramia flava JLT2011]MCP9200531.1 DsrE family protein [Gramella oceanisediminis]MDT0642625.1 DsrE family protein [Zunongwangia sp. F363]OSS39599.1 hypothetical protein C723_1501 [Christiangramia flava JLT2011]